MDVGGVAWRARLGRSVHSLTVVINLHLGLFDGLEKKEKGQVSRRKEVEQRQRHQS